MVCGQGTGLDPKCLTDSAKVPKHLSQQTLMSYLFIELHQRFGLFQVVQAEVSEKQVP